MEERERECGGEERGRDRVCVWGGGESEREVYVLCRHPLPLVICIKYE